MRGKHKFEQQIKLLEKEIGESGIDQVYRIYAATTEWLFQVGQGTAELNAINHKFSKKIAFRVVNKID